jgi:hypothetical protein
LLNVKYVITDKLQDVWSGGVYYDLEHRVPLGELEITDLPSFEATQLGVVTYLTGTADLPNGTPVAQIVVQTTDTTTFTATLRAGRDTAEGLYDARPVAHDRALVIHHWRDNERGNDYLAVSDLSQSLRLSRIVIRSLLPRQGAAQAVLRGLSLIDARTGTSRSVSIVPTFRLVHSGDVKVYQNLGALPRAFVVHQARVTGSDAQAVDWLSDPRFDPGQEVLLAPDSASTFSGQYSAPATEGPSETDIIRYDPERIDLQASLETPGYLILTDAFYPGWQAEVDGRPVPILRADVYFRAIALDSGEHTVTFQYSPPSALWGFRVGSAAWLVWVLAVAAATLRAGRKHNLRV